MSNALHTIPKIRAVLTGWSTVSGFDLAWFSSLSSKHLFHTITYHLGRSSLGLPLAMLRPVKMAQCARSSPREDHRRALAACMRRVPPDWRRPAGRPSHTWLHAIEAELGAASQLPGERPLLETNGDILWTQQRSSGVRSERRRRMCMPCRNEKKGLECIQV